MKAILVKEPGGADQLYIGETETPTPKQGEVLVKVKATALNRMDLLQRQGRYPLPKDASPILGVDMAGVVESVGDGVTQWVPGDEVFGLLQGGGYAEYATIHHELLWKKPNNLSFAEAAAIPEVFMTAYQTLFFVGEAKPGEQVLIHAGASGVGTAAVQLCKEKGLECFVTAGSRDKIDACRKLGAKSGFNYKLEDFSEELRKENSHKGVDVILDFIGASYWDKNLAALNRNGRLVIIGFMGGVKVPEANLGLILRNWLQVRGTTLRARSQDYRVRLAKELGAFALPHFQEGKLKPILHEVLSWESVQEAHRMMEANENTGKIVLEIAV